MTKAGEKMLAGAREALAAARGETPFRFYDGRMFGWQKSEVSLSGYTPVIVWDKLHGSTKNFEIVRLQPLKIEHYNVPLAELAALYPAPAQQE